VEKFVMGIKEFKATSWDEKLEWVKRYIDENKRLPSSSNNNLLKSYYRWFSNQQRYYKSKKYTMSVNKNYTNWTLFINDPIYKKYVLPNDSIWDYKLNCVINYMNLHNKRPSSTFTNVDKEEKSLGKWIDTQLKNYKKNAQIMSDEIYRKKWEKFITNTDYKKYFLSNKEEWLIILDDVKEYINIYEHRPTSSSDNINIKKLGYWVNHQIENYNKHSRLMKDDEIKKLWEEFINNDLYKSYFLSNEDHWKKILNEIKIYINDTKTKPMSSNENETIQFYAIWMMTQKKNYKNNLQIMSNIDFRKLWEEFINDPKYKQYF
jgi:hypothetical protein